MTEFTGYPIELEDQEYIRSLSRETNVLAMRGTYNEVRLDVRSLAIVENQGGQGACAGHSLSSVMEWIYVVLHGEAKWMQLSRAMGYYEAQKLSGIRGDRGSTISAGVKLAIDTGLCREELWRYPRSYNPARPSDYSAVLADAKTTQSAAARRSPAMTATGRSSARGSVESIRASAGTARLTENWSIPIPAADVTAGIQSVLCACLPELILTAIRTPGFSTHGQTHGGKTAGPSGVQRRLNRCCDIATRRS